MPKKHQAPPPLLEVAKDNHKYYFEIDEDDIDLEDGTPLYRRDKNRRKRRNSISHSPLRINKSKDDSDMESDESIGDEDDDGIEDISPKDKYPKQSKRKARRNSLSPRFLSLDKSQFPLFSYRDINDPSRKLKNTNEISNNKNNNNDNNNNNNNNNKKTNEKKKRKEKEKPPKDEAKKRKESNDLFHIDDRKIEKLKKANQLTYDEEEDDDDKEEEEMKEPLSLINNNNIIHLSHNNSNDNENNENNNNNKMEGHKNKNEKQNKESDNEDEKNNRSKGEKKTKIKETKEQDIDTIVRSIKSELTKKDRKTIEKIRAEVDPIYQYHEHLRDDFNLLNSKQCRFRYSKYDDVGDDEDGSGDGDGSDSLDDPLKNEKEVEVLRSAIEEFKQERKEMDKENQMRNKTISVPVILQRLPSSPSFSSSSGVRVMNWNIQWMEKFYKNDEEFLEENDKGVVDDVLTRMAQVILKIDPDVLAIEEGPSSVQRMDLFIDTYLSSSYSTFGGMDGGPQRIYILVKKNRSLRGCKLDEKSYEFFTKEWAFDLNGDMQFTPYHFVRIPIIISGHVMINGRKKTIFIIAIHAKSKMIREGRELWDHRLEEEQRNLFIKQAVKNRRKIAGECLRIRKYIDNEIFKNYDDPFIVAMGDLNDGPGRDFFEERYLLFDSIDALLGSPFSGKKLLQPLLIHQKFISKKDQWTYTCYDYVDDVDRNIMLDHIFVTEGLMEMVKQATVAHEIFEEYNGIDHGPKYLSDHRPIFADFSFESYQFPSKKK